MCLGDAGEREGVAQDADVDVAVDGDSLKGQRTSGEGGEGVFKGTGVI